MSFYKDLAFKGKKAMRGERSIHDGVKVSVFFFFFEVKFLFFLSGYGVERLYLYICIPSSQDATRKEA